LNLTLTLVENTGEKKILLLMVLGITIVVAAV
jgi:hypothetical protein